MTNADEYYVNRARHIAVSLDTETVRAECGAGYLFVTAGADGNWRCEGQRGFGCMA